MKQLPKRIVKKIRKGIWIYESFKDRDYLDLHLGEEFEILIYFDAQNTLEKYGSTDERLWTCDGPEVLMWDDMINSVVFFYVEARINIFSNPLIVDFAKFEYKTREKTEKWLKENGVSLLEKNRELEIWTNKNQHLLFVHDFIRLKLYKRILKIDL